MKKITGISTLLLASFTMFAQDGSNEPKPIIDSGFMHELLTTSGVLLALFLVTSFFLNLVRTWLDNKLKNKLIERGATENIVSQLLQPLQKDNKLEPFKWFTILAGIGAGLTFINMTQPMGIHSLAIMAFCLAASFLGYYFFSKKSAV